MRIRSGRPVTPLLKVSQLIGESLREIFSGTRNAQTHCRLGLPLTDRGSQMIGVQMAQHAGRDELKSTIPRATRKIGDCGRQNGTCSFETRLHWTESVSNAALLGGRPPGRE